MKTNYLINKQLGEAIHLHLLPNLLSEGLLLLRCSLLELLLSLLLLLRPGLLLGLLLTILLLWLTSWCVR